MIYMDLNSNTEITAGKGMDITLTGIWTLII